MSRRWPGHCVFLEVQNEQRPGWRGWSWRLAAGASVCIKVASETLCFPGFMSTALVLAKVSPAEAESWPGKAKGRRSLKAEGTDDKWSAVSLWIFQQLEQQSHPPETHELCMNWSLWTYKEAQCVWPTGPFDRSAIVLHCRSEVSSEGFWVVPSVNGLDAVLFSFKFLSTFLYYFCLPLPVSLPVVSRPITLLSACPAPWTLSTPGIMSPLWIELWAGRPDNQAC